LCHYQIAMQSESTDTDVLIVGAGPVGLFLANECARRRLRFRIVESNATQSVYSKALAIFPRTFEIFDMAGLSGPFLAAANVVTSVAIVERQQTLAQIVFKPEESPYPFVAMVPQDVTEKLLVDQLEHRGATVEYETTLVSAEQTSDHVQASLERRGERTDVRAAYVMGCDGAHSAVRHLLNLAFEGGIYPDSFMLADITTNETLPANQLQLCPNELGPLAIFPMSATRRRIVATIQNAEGDAPSLDLVRETLAQRGPDGIVAESLRWSSYFRIHHRHVTQMSHGRMFVAGDAAHVHSPIGGQGMNTGLQDAWNLAWKLDLDVRGHATDELLASYTLERTPIVKGVIEMTDLMTRALSARNPVARAVRDTAIPIASRLPAFQHAFVQRLSGLGNNYKGSPIVEGSGRRYFDDSLRGGQGIASRFLLMLGVDADAATHAAAAELSTALPEALDVRSYAGEGIILLRPDGYVAYEAPKAGAAAFPSIRALLQRQIR
jgi:2-polyprenyl-6-methoxyphenol hydroxylase-like FAD-dependent oxidoreductase